MIYKIRQIKEPYPSAGYYQIQYKTNEKYPYIIVTTAKEVTQEILNNLKNSLTCKINTARMKK